MGDMEPQPSNPKDYDPPENHDEAFDEAAYGSAFRRTWRDEETPLCILGQAFYNCVSFYAIRLKPRTKRDTTKALKDPYDNLNETNVVYTIASDFNKRFPLMVIEYFEERLEFVEEDDVRIAPMRKHEEDAKSTPYKELRLDLLGTLKKMGIAAINERDIFGEAMYEEGNDDGKEMMISSNHEQEEKAKKKSKSRKKDHQKKSTEDEQETMRIEEEEVEEGQHNELQTCELQEKLSKLTIG